MRIKIIVILFLVFGFKDELISQPSIFHKVYLGTLGETMFPNYQNLQTSDHGYLIGNSATLMKLDSNGVKMWRKEMNFNANLVIAILAISTDFNNGYMMAGGTVITSLTNNYNINWMREVISTNSIGIYSIKKTNDFIYILGGVTSVNSEPVPCLMKVDTSGTILWSKVYLSVNKVEGISSMVYLPDGGILASGTSRSHLNPGPLFDCVIFKLDSNGIVQWSKRYTSLNSSTYGTCIQSLSTGEFIVSGKRNLHRYLMKIDALGNILWTKNYQAGLVGNSKYVIVTNDNGYAMTGENTDTVPGGTGQTSVLIKTDSLGNLEWSRTLGGYGDVSSSHLMQTSDGGYAISGRRTTTGSSYSLNLIKTDSLGHTGGCLEGPLNVTVTNLNDTVMDFLLTDSIISVTTMPVNLSFPLIGTEVDLCNFQGIENLESPPTKMQINPNPNSGAFKLTILKFINNLGYVEIINNYGQVVYRNSFVSNPNYISLPESIQSGMYVCRLITENYTVNKKFIINK